MSYQTSHKEEINGTMRKGGVLMKEKKFDDLFDVNMNVQEDVHKTIYYRINKEIMKRILVVVLGVVVVIGGSYYGIGKILEWTQYSPYKDYHLLIEDDNSKDFDLLMQTYIGMYYPGMTYVDSHYQDLGKGKYQIDMRIHDAGFPLRLDGSTNVTMTIKSSKIEYTDSNHMLSRTIDEFYNESMDTRNHFDRYIYFTEKTLQELKELPDSAIVHVSLSFKEAQSLDSVLSFIRKYKDSSFVWLATTPLQSMPQIYNGLTLYDATMHGLTEENKKKYPQFYLENNDYTAQDVTQNYLSKMKLLLDNPDFVSLINRSYPLHPIEELEKTYQDVLENGIHPIGVKGYVKKNDLLKMIENQEVDYIFITDVRMSSLQK